MATYRKKAVRFPSRDTRAVWGGALFGSMIIAPHLMFLFAPSTIPPQEQTTTPVRVHRPTQRAHPTNPTERLEGVVAGEAWHNQPSLDTSSYCISVSGPGGDWFFTYNGVTGLQMDAKYNAGDTVTWTWDAWPE